MDGGIGPLELVGPWIGYRVFKKKKQRVNTKKKKLGVIYITSNSPLNM